MDPQPHREPDHRLCDHLDCIARRTTARAIGTNRTFGEAIAALKAGGRVARHGWNGKGMWLQLQVPDANSKMGHPYPYMKGVDGKFFPWNPNALDLMAEDWMDVTPVPV